MGGELSGRTLEGQIEIILILRPKKRAVSRHSNGKVPMRDLHNFRALASSLSTVVFRTVLDTCASLLHTRMRCEFVRHSDGCPSPTTRKTRQGAVGADAMIHHSSVPTTPCAVTLPAYFQTSTFSCREQFPAALVNSRLAIRLKARCMRDFIEQHREHQQWNRGDPGQ